MILFKFKWCAIVNYFHDYFSNIPHLSNSNNIFAMIHCNVTSSDIDKTHLMSDIDKFKYFLYVGYKDIA